jgi:hypothetical protein
MMRTGMIERRLDRAPAGSVRDKKHWHPFNAVA